MNGSGKNGAPRPLVVVVEDDQSIRHFLRTGLWAHGFEVGDADTGARGLSMISSRNPDLVILDLNLPDMDGVNLVQQLRRWSQVPIIVLSARGDEHDKVSALESGADDYMTKPFGLAELVARIQVALRRNVFARRGEVEGKFTVGDICVDLLRHKVHRAGRETHLTPKEFTLLSTLIRHAGRVVTHRQLMTAVWGPANEDKNHYLRIYMAALRHKLEADPARPKLFMTEAGTGYRLETENIA